MKTMREAILCGVNIRGALYFLIPLLTPISAVVVEASKADTYPTMPTLLGAVASGVIGALVAFRAYIDGSAQRAKDEEAR